MDDTKVAASASTHASAKPGRRSHAGANTPARATALGAPINASESCSFITKIPHVLEPMSALKVAQRGVVGQGFRMQVIFFYA
jgi:hypothetical protein